MFERNGNWKLKTVFLMVLALLTAASVPAATEPAPAEKARIQSAYGKLPLYFIQNDGQVDKKVKYYEKGAGHATFFAEDGVYLNLTKAKPGKDTKDNSAKPDPAKEAKRYQAETVKLSLVKSNPHPRIVAEEKQAGKINYFTGSDKSQWKTDIATYAAVRYEEAYKGVDVRYYGNNSQIEYDVIVKPGADPKQVKFQYQGIKGMKVTEAGELEIRLKEGNIVQKTPYIYQEIDGKRVEVDGQFKILAKKNGQFSYGFQVAAYDTTRELVIDPTLVYSTYLGGSNTDEASAIAVDSSGNAYVTGITSSTDFPITSALDGSYNGGGSRGYDVFVTKINSSGTVLVYSTYLGGSNDDISHGITVDSSGNAYVVGDTFSSDFPTANAIYSIYKGTWDAFVTKIDPSGSILVYSTYLGGSSNYDTAYGIAVDATGNAYVVGETASTDFPTVNAFQATANNLDRTDAFITKINSSGSALVYSTYLGGSAWDSGRGIAVDSSGNVYVTGWTRDMGFGSTFPIANALYPVLKGYSDAFVTKISPTGSALVYSTFLGGSSYDEANAIAIDSSGNAYVAGYTYSTDFPTANAIYPTNKGVWTDAFITKINPSGTALIYSTYLGGGSGWGDDALGIAVDSSGNAYVAGYTYSTDFPTANALDTTLNGTLDAFVTKINPSGSALIYSTFLGGSGEEYAHGIAVDTSGNVYVVGHTPSTNFPTVAAIQGANAGFSDAFIAKMTTPSLIGGSIQGIPLNLTSSNAAVTTLAGLAGSGGSTDGTGSLARFYNPYGITTDGTNLFIADSFNHTIRKVVIATGVVTTIAGSQGIIGSVDGIGSVARFYEPKSITTDGTNLFVADFRNHTIRKIVIATGAVTTIAGSAGSPGSTDGIGSAARFNTPIGITTDGPNLFVADSYNYTIRKIVISTGVVSTLAGSAGSSGSIDGTGSAARFWDTYGITTDGANLFVADTLNHTIRKIVISTGVVSTLAGSAGSSGSTDGTGSAGRFFEPMGISTDGTYLYIGDNSNNTIRKIVIITGAVSTFAGSAGSSGSTDGTGLTSRFYGPIAITTDGINLFVSDYYNQTIRKISPAASDTTPPTTTASPAGGTYTSAQSVTLTCSDGTGSGCGNIYYTTNGTTPDIFSTVYTVPINISATTTLKHFAVDLAGNGELVKTAVYTIASSTGIDLTVSSLSAPVSAATGTNISIPNTIRNLGTVISTTSYVKFYLSSDTVIDAITDVYLAQRSVGSLAAGASSSATTSLKIPVSVAPGTYYIGAIADATNTNTESDETNNTASTTAITVSSGVDLTVSSFSAPLSIATGVNVSLSNTISNLGTGATVTSYVKFYLSTDSTIDSSDTYLTQRSIGALAGGASSTANTTIKLPVTLSPGTYYIGAIADETNTNVESDETNNKAVSGAITVLSGVDLAVSTFSVPSSIETGTSVVVSNIVTNSGVGATATSYLKIYLSTDSTIDSSDTYLTQRSVSSLNGGATSSASTTIKLPVTLSPGIYYIGAIADETNTNVESDETNNKAVSGAITVTSGVDLVVSSLSVPSTIETGVNVSLSNTVANLGPGATATSYLKIYLSTDSTIDTSDTYLTQRSVGSIAGGASSSANTTIKLPVTLSPGTYYIGAIADETNTNIESDETNNTAFTAAITVTVQSGIDFVVSSFSAPSTIYTGTNVSISNTVTKNGVGTSTTSYVKFYLSTDAAIDSSDTYITQRSVSSLNGGVSSSASTTIKLPVTINPGTYYIALCVNIVETPPLC